MAQLPGVRYGTGLSISQAGPEAAAVAMSTQAMEPQNADSHALYRRAQQGVSRRPLRDHTSPSRGGAALACGPAVVGTPRPARGPDAEMVREPRDDGVGAGA